VALIIYTPIHVNMSFHPVDLAYPENSYFAIFFSLCYKTDINRYNRYSSSYLSVLWLVDRCVQRTQRDVMYHISSTESCSNTRHSIICSHRNVHTFASAYSVPWCLLLLKIWTLIVVQETSESYLIIRVLLYSLNIKLEINIYKQTFWTAQSVKWLAVGWTISV
jgi:hypothetical protein